MRAVVVQFIIPVDNILHFHLAVLDLLLFRMVVLEPLLVIVDRVFFDGRRARPIRLHVLLLRIVRPVARLEIDLLIMLLLVHWLQGILGGIRVIS